MHLVVSLDSLPPYLASFSFLFSSYHQKKYTLLLPVYGMYSGTTMKADSGRNITYFMQCYIVNTQNSAWHIVGIQYLCVAWMNEHRMTVFQRAESQHFLVPKWRCPFVPSFVDSVTETPYALSIAQHRSPRITGRLPTTQLAYVLDPAGL